MCTDVFTFKEDELLLTVLIHSVDLRRQTFPELTDLHGVSGHHGIIPHPPEPLVLMRHRQQLYHRYDSNVCL